MDKISTAEKRDFQGQTADLNNNKAGNNLRIYFSDFWSYKPLSHRLNPTQEALSQMCGGYSVFLLLAAATLSSTKRKPSSLHIRLDQPSTAIEWAMVPTEWAKPKTLKEIAILLSHL